MSPLGWLAVGLLAWLLLAAVTAPALGRHLARMSRPPSRGDDHGPVDDDREVNG